MSMISYLKGLLLFKGNNFLILDVNGLGFRIFVSERTLHNLPGKGEKLEVFCHLDISDRSMKLFGFLKEEELDLFRMVRNISGVGPKAALEISALGSFERAKKEIEQGSFKVFEEIPGIGKKKAKKVILELSGKINTEGQKTADKRSRETEEAVSGLAALGFKKSEAEQALSNVPYRIKEPEKRIKEALKFIGRKAE